ncbi:sulfite exporter TauE/SafE family protein [Dyella sp. BiH032]|uniref:sulfite exporter TauE/SafE family protein n=1 Tax=Dyella sp. BiH032 TaxID=3075430 RepID=UPI002892A8D0|nr:sulfite exporter TauE/SafE family protein [Dyella sp. BiH032]WNL44594.1 sulfite exporter TauE/SafE family protein [Dyella sp. BiH032]
MSQGLGLLAALWLGLAASGHCVLMCGGISGALALGTKRGANGRPSPHLLLAYQCGRIGGYALAGLLFGSIGAGLYVLLDHDGLRAALRVLAALAFATAAMALLGGRGWLERAIGARLWQRLAPKARALFPVNTVPRALGVGLLWGWMPCGFVYTVLLLALASFDPWRSAASMLAFGLGTLPSMLAAGVGSGVLSRWLGWVGFRRAGAVLLLVMAVGTVAGPLVARWGMPVLGRWLPFDC